MSEKLKETVVDELLNENIILKEKLSRLEESQRAKWNFRFWLAKRIGEAVIGRGLKKSLYKLYDELPTNVKKDTLADVSAHLIWRLTRLGIFAALLAVIPSVLLFQQNRLISKQNDKIKIQTELLESDRRSALVFLMGNIMDKVDQELLDTLNNKGRHLSPQLIGRIVALSQGFKPYRLLENNLLTFELSPERGQLLLSLVNSKLHFETYATIYPRSNFSKADLRNFKDIGGIYYNVNLSESNMKGASFLHCNFIGANLSKANLQDVKLGSSDLARADLRNAIFNDRTDFRNVRLEEAKVESLDWFNKLSKSNVRGVDSLMKIYEVEELKFEPLKDDNGEIYYLIIHKTNAIN